MPPILVLIFQASCKALPSHAGRGGAPTGGNPRSACGLKGVLPRGPAARLAPSRTLWGQAVPCTFPFSNAFRKRKRRLCLCQSTHKDALVSMCGIVPPRGHAVKVLRMFVKVSQIPRKTPPFLAQCCKNSPTPLQKTAFSSILVGKRYVPLALWEEHSVLFLLKEGTGL